MPTVRAYLEQTRQRLSPGRRDVLNKLDGAIANGTATSFTFAYDAGVVAGTRVSVGVEDIHLWEASSVVASPVERGINASTAVAHADDLVVRMDPEFSDWDILRAFNETLHALPGWGVYKYDKVNLTSNAAKVGYNLTSVTDMFDVFRVRYEVPGGEDAWVDIPRYTHALGGWRSYQNESTDDFASGEAIMVHGHVPSGQRLQVHYRAPFTQFAFATDADLDDDIETQSSLPPFAHPLLAVGAAIRLTQGRALQRSDLSAQGATRRPDEVTTGDTRAAGDPLTREWLTLVRGVVKQQRQKAN